MLEKFAPRFVSRAEEPIKGFMEQAFYLWPRECHSSFGKRISGDVFSGVIKSENQIFMLGAPNVKELDQLELFLEDRQRQKIEPLLALLRNFAPVRVADFRICLDTNRAGEAFLANITGVQSSSHPVEFFRPRSRQTFKKRCQELQGLPWTASEKLREPFVSYCIGGGARN